MGLPVIEVALTFDTQASVSLVLCCATSDSELERRREATRRGLGEDEPAIIDAGAHGKPQQVVDRIGEFLEVGVSRVYLEVYDMTDLDQLALVAQEVLPHFAAPGSEAGG